MSMSTDLELIAKVKQGDTGVFGELVERHQKFLLKSVVRLTRDKNLAEDVVQDAFLKAFRKIHLFEGRSSFRSWLYQIAMNTAKNKFRAMSRETVDVSNIDISVEGQAENAVVAMDVRELVQRELSLLPNKQRRAMSLRIYEDLSFKEIAEIMDCPYDTAKANYRHGLMKMRDRLQKNSVLRGWSETTRLSLTEIGQTTMEVDG